MEVIVRFMITQMSLQLWSPIRCHLGNLRFKIKNRLENSKNIISGYINIKTGRNKFEHLS